jgi:hypothetical protein
MAKNARGARVPPGWGGHSRARFLPGGAIFQFFHTFAVLGIGSAGSPFPPIPPFSCPSTFVSKKNLDTLHGAVILVISVILTAQNK